MYRLRDFDWFLIASVALLLVFGLFSMKSLSGGNDYFFTRQLVWVALGFGVLFAAAFIDWRIFESGIFILVMYAIGVLLLLMLFLTSAVRGVSSWFDLGAFALEPVELMKVLVILMLAKYFSRRHIEIALIRHIFISFVYVAIPLALVFLQPDIGSAAILLVIWVAMLLFSGMNVKQVLGIGLSGIAVVVLLWVFALAPYQKSRIISFVQPGYDPRGAGYHSTQAMIAVGSGGMFGKGVGYGTQSRLKFLPESETDFIFAAFAEEWGFMGIVVLFSLYMVLFWRILTITMHAQDNFGRFMGLGIAAMLLGHIIIHVGMNMGLLPITGIGLPFVSYGGSFLITLMAVLGLLQSVSMRSSFFARVKGDDVMPVGP